MATDRYDVIVIGLGGHGSSVLYHAAKRGLRVLGLEQFDLGHARGSSHGVHRLLRLGYAEGRAYVPLLLRAVDLWRELQQAAGEPLFVRSGVLSASPGGTGNVADTISCSAAFGIRHEVLDAAAINKRFAAFNLRRDMVGILQHDAGFLMSEQAIAAHLRLAMHHGADVRARTPVTALEETGSAVRVVTPAGTFAADQVVVTAGPWIGKVVPSLAPLHTIGRRALGFFLPRQPKAFAADACPGYTFSNEHLSIYGFPIHGFPGVKIGRDGHLGEAGDPDTLSRDVTAADEACLREGVRAFLRDCDGPCIRLQACVLNDTPDRHFIIDRLAPGSRVHIASMCSGHGFKFTAVTGELMADRLQGKPDRFDLAPFRLGRFRRATTASE